METMQSITISLELANKIIDALDDMTSISEKRKIHYELCNIVEKASESSNIDVFVCEMSIK